MSQHVMPGDLAGTISATKGRVSRLERELSAVRRKATGKQTEQIIHGVRLGDPTGVIQPSPGPVDTVAAVVWHPTGANLTGVSVFAMGLEDDEEGTPQNATVSVMAAPAGKISEQVPSPVKTGGGVDITRLPYSTWWGSARIETARTWVPAMSYIAFAISAPLHAIIVSGVLFEFDTGPRERAA